jgi:hypothetical protein
LDRGGTRAAFAILLAIGGGLVPVFACDSREVPVLLEATRTEDPNACAKCQTSLEAACATSDGGTSCPPDLDSPDLYAWVENEVLQGRILPPVCTQAAE